MDPADPLWDVVRRLERERYQKPVGEFGPVEGPTRRMMVGERRKQVVRLSVRAVQRARAQIRVSRVQGRSVERNDPGESKEEAG